MKNQEGIINITLVVVIVVIAVLMVGAAWWYENNKEKVISNSNTITNTTTQSIFSKIESHVATGADIAIVTNRRISNIPPDIITGQVGDVFILENILLVQIKQRDRNFSVDPYDAELAWAGILTSIDKGKSWQKYFSVFGGEIIHNIVGLFTKGNILYIDVADARGAGSGEGNLTRLSSTNGGQTWSKENCYYLIPESYYTPPVSNWISIVPDGLETSTACVFDTLSITTE